MKVVFEAFAVEHSLNARAVGDRISGGGRSASYVPDVARICDEARALAGIDVYLGDGATVTRSILRRRDGVLIGHASIRAQIAWCQAHGVTRAIFTHCGSQTATNVFLTRSSGACAEIAASKLKSRMTEWN